MDTRLAPDPLLRNVPPNSLEAERAVLGAILVDPRAIDEVAQSLAVEDFYSQAHVQIYETIVSLWQQNKPVDVVLLNEELSNKGVLDQIGGTATLAELSEVVPTAANAAYYAKIVRDRAMQRRLIEIAAKVQKDAFETSGSVEELMDRSESSFFAVTQQRIRNEAVAVGTVVTEALQSLMDKERGGGVVGIPSGFADLDELTSGFSPGEMTILAARPSMGKTSLALNILSYVVLYKGSTAAFFSLEMPRLQVTSNMLCSIAKIDGHRLRGGFLNKEEKRNFLNACEMLEPARLFIDDSPALSTMELRAKGRRLKAQHNVEMIVIDYMQLMTGSAEAARQSRQIEVSEISRQVKALARELEIPIICLAQLSRKVEERKEKKPMMSDLRESGCLTGGTLVTLADSGRRVPIRDLEGRSDFGVWAVDPETYTLHRAVVSRAFTTGVKPVFRLTTALGRSIRATANHKFLTLDGWRRLDELKVGGRLAVARSGQGRQALTAKGAKRRSGAATGATALASLASLAVQEQEPHTANRVLWDSIVSIEPAGTEPVYDLTVPGLHSFVADEVIVHNSIEQDADKILLLYRPEYYEPDKEELRGKAHVVVAKNRNGPTGEAEMLFVRNQMRFASMTRM